MNDPAELLLRDVLTEDAAAAPPAGDLALSARRRLRRRRAATAGAALALVALAGGVVRAVTPGRERASLTSTDAGPLVGTEWRLVEYVRGGRTVVLPGDVDSTLRFSDRDTFSGTVCNHLGGDAAIDGSRVTMRLGFKTEMACAWPEGEAQTDFEAFIGEPLTWHVDGARLRLTAPNGDYFLYRERESIYEDLSARTVVAGTHDGYEYRLAYAPDGRLSVEARRGPGYGWYGEAMAEDTKFPMSWAMRVPVGGGTQFVAGFATDRTASVRHQTPAGRRTALTIYVVDGRTVFGGLVPANPKGSRITLHRADGTVLATFTENRPA